MSDDYGWEDPFAEDEQARERARRRAERDARRRGEQSSLGDKVKAEQAGAPPPPADQLPGADPAIGADAATSQPPTGEHPAAGEQPPTGERPAAPAGAPPTGERTPTGERPASAAPRSRTPAHDQISPGALWARRALGIVVLLSAIAVVIVALRAVGDVVGGKDEPTPPVAEAKVLELTIPEGLDRRQVAELTKQEEIEGDYAEASKAFKGFDLERYGAAGAPNLEGFLFPDTYELERDATADDLVGRQLDAFKDNLSGVDLTYAKSKNLNVYDVLKIASMIEREIQVPEERELAAAVIYNRLRANTPLGIDATIRYEDQNYDEQLTESRLAEETPYNTRVIAGLPPTPIGNPGLASIEAAANPANSDAFYFVVKPGTCGEHVFVETEDEFLAAEAEYQAALAEEGGSPTEC